MPDVHKDSTKPQKSLNWPRMLVSFSVENFRSIRDVQTLSTGRNVSMNDAPFQDSLDFHSAFERYVTWQGFLNPEIHPCPSVSSVVKNISLFAFSAFFCG